MTHFPGLLQRFLDRQQLSIRQFSAVTGQHDTHLSQVLKGNADLSRTNLVKIYEAVQARPGQLGITEAEAAQLARGLVVTWLRDQIPAHILEHLVIRAHEVSGVSEVDVEIDPLGDALAWFQATAPRQASIADWLISMKAMLTEPTMRDARLASARLHREQQGESGK